MKRIFLFLITNIAVLLTLGVVANLLCTYLLGTPIEQLVTMESTGVAISYAPQEAAERIEAFRRNYANLKQVLVESGMEEAEADKFVQKAY